MKVVDHLYDLVNNLSAIEDAVFDAYLYSADTGITVHPDGRMAQYIDDMRTIIPAKIRLDLWREAVNATPEADLDAVVDRFDELIEDYLSSIELCRVFRVDSLRPRHFLSLYYHSTTIGDSFYFADTGAGYSLKDDYPFIQAALLVANTDDPEYYQSDKFDIPRWLHDAIMDTPDIIPVCDESSRLFNRMLQTGEFMSFNWIYHETMRAIAATNGLNPEDTDTIQAIMDEIQSDSGEFYIRITHPALDYGHVWLRVHQGMRTACIVFASDEHKIAKEQGSGFFVTFEV